MGGCKVYKRTLGHFPACAHAHTGTLACMCTCAHWDTWLYVHIGRTLGCVCACAPSSLPPLLSVQAHAHTRQAVPAVLQRGLHHPAAAGGALHQPHDAHEGRQHPGARSSVQMQYADAVRVQWCKIRIAAAISGRRISRTERTTVHPSAHNVRDTHRCFGRAARCRCRWASGGR